MLEKRRSARRRMVLPVKVLVDQTLHLAHTVDITGAGARIGGLREKLLEGAVVELQRGSRKAKFTVRWVRPLGPNEIQIGVECSELQDKFWGVDLSAQDQESRKEMDALMTLLGSGGKTKAASTNS
jgi:hypothetical protein